MPGKVASKPLIAIALAAATLVGVGGYSWHESNRPKVLEIYIFDTPGSPAALIRTPNDKRVLINGGSNSEVIKYLSDILPFYSRRIDSIIATNADGDHVSGLIDTVDRYVVDDATVPAVTLDSLGLASTTDPIYEVFMKTLKDRGIVTKKIAAGTRLILDGSETKAVTADILFPVEFGEFKYSRASSPELILRVNYDATAALFIGDASIKVQRYIAGASSTPVDALITSLNASPSNLSIELMNSAAPDFIVYSQAIKKSAATTGKSADFSKKKLEPDPLAGILDSDRFNLRELGKIKVTSDGVTLKTEKAP